MGHCLAAVRAGNPFAEMQRQRVNADVFAMGGHSDADHPAPRAAQPVCLLDNGGIAGIVDADVSAFRLAAFGKNARDGRGAVACAAVDHVRGPEPAGKFQAIVKKINGNNGKSPRKGRPLYHIQPDPSGTENHNGFTNGGFRRH